MDNEQLATAHTCEVYDPRCRVDYVLRHPLNVRSAYREVTGVEAEFTSCHDRFCGTVDYIWYTPQVSRRLFLITCRAFFVVHIALRPCLEASFSKRLSAMWP